MSVQWTQSQRSAIKERNKNILVSAGAGSGKTAVMVQRVIEMITDEQRPIDVDELLVVTFTNAAAEEMKERIRVALLKEIQKNPEDHRLKTQYVLIHKATITTIHAFCADVIRSHYHLLDVDPSFQVADETQAKILKESAMEEMIEDLYEEGHPNFLRLVDSFGWGKDDGQLIDIIHSLYFHIKGFPDDVTWLEEKSSHFDLEGSFEDTLWAKQLRRFALENLIDMKEQNQNLLDQANEYDGLEGYTSTLEKDDVLYQTAIHHLQQASWDGLYTYFQSTQFDRLGRVSKEADEQIKETVKSLRNDLKKQFGKLSDLFGISEKENKEHCEKLYPLIKMMTQMVLDLDQRFLAKKQALGLLDFNDLEHFSLTCLRLGANEYYKEKFKELFIDEYQDSNLVQEELLTMVSKGNNIFMVGDVKQSIYSFRNATPKLFLEKYHSYPLDADQKNQKILLYENFRSHPTVLQFCNYIFKGIMNEKTGNVLYTQNEYLTPGRNEQPSDYEHQNQVVLISGEKDEDFLDDTKNKEKEVAVIGEKILDLVKRKKAEFKDIMILMRSIKGWGDVYTKQFQRMEIPFYSEQQSSFFDCYEIQIVFDLLRIIDNPLQDIPLVAVLRSPMYGFFDRTLAQIKSNHKKNLFFEAMEQYDKEDDTKQKIQSFLSDLTDFSAASKKQPMHVFLWEVLTKTGYYESGLEKTAKEKKQANLRMLFDICVEFEKTRMTGLFQLIQFLESYKEKNQDLSEAKQIDENENAVRLMSIHKSKGLEFPIVILAGCGKKFNTQDVRSRLVLHRQLGFGPEYLDEEQGISMDTSAKKATVIQINQERLAEEMRILYVALTRAKEQCIITGLVNNPQKKCTEWILSSSDRSANCFLDWIMARMAKHHNGKIIYDIADLYPSGQWEQDPLDATIQYMGPKDILDALDQVDVLKNLPQEAKPKDLKQQQEWFDWTYPHVGEIGLERRISVTEISKLKSTGWEDFENRYHISDLMEKPTCLTEQLQMDPLTKGTKIHQIFAATDLNKAQRLEHIQALCMNAQLDDQDAQGIFAFYNSEVGKRFLAAKERYREKPFILPVLTKELIQNENNKIPNDHVTNIQGVIDCMFVENDQVVLIDYKTDRIKPEQVSQRALDYQTQLEYYARAITNLLGKKVTEKYIYFTHLHVLEKISDKSLFQSQP